MAVSKGLKVIDKIKEIRDIKGSMFMPKTQKSGGGANVGRLPISFVCLCLFGNFVALYTCGEPVSVQVVHLNFVLILICMSSCDDHILLTQSRRLKIWFIYC